MRYFVIGLVYFSGLVLSGIVAAALDQERYTVMTCQLSQTASERETGDYACVLGDAPVGANFHVVPGSPFDQRLQTLVGRIVDVKLEVVR